jgi:hypothetical protein
MALTSRKYYLNRTRMLLFLNHIEKSIDNTAMSLYLPAGLAEGEVEDITRDSGLRSIPDELIPLTTGSKTGAVIFWSEELKCLVLPPFPSREEAIFTGYSVEPLRLLLANDYKVGLVLVHLGSYAVGYCRGEKLVSSKVGTGLIHGRHKKGGSSQQRFQRRRQNQVSEFLDRVCIHAVEHLKLPEEELDYIIYGGPWQTVLSLKKRCPFLQSLEARELPLIEVPSLRRAVLERTVSRIWSSEIIEWQDE